MMRSRGNIEWLPPTRGTGVIAIVALLLVAVMVTLGNQSFKATEKATFDEFNQRQLVLAQGTTGGLELYFETLAGDVRALGRIPEVQRLDEAPTRQELQRRFDELEPLGVNDMGVLDADGVLRYNVVAHQIEGVDFSWRRYYQEAKAMTSSDTYVIEFIEFKGVEAGQKGVLVAVPMFEPALNENSSAPSGQFAGIVLCTLKLDTITQRFVAPVQSSERGHAFLIDDEYNVLWAADGTLFGKNLLEEGAGFPAFQQVVERMGSGNSGAAEYTYYKYADATGEYTGDREEKLIAYASIHLGKELWAIGVWAPKEDARKLIRAVYLRQLLVVGLSILTILLGSSYTLATSFRISKFLADEVEIKTKELKESHERLVTVLDSLDAAVYVADMETYEILFANKYIQNLLGDVVGKTCWQVLQVGQSGPCDFCTNAKLLTADGEPSGVYSWEFQNTITGRWYDIRDQAILWVNDRIVRLEIAIDITARKGMEQQLIHAGKLSAIGQLSASIIHEVSNPLQAIIGFLDLAQEAGREDEEVREYLEITYREALRIVRTVNRVRGFSPLEAGEDREISDINNLVQQVLELTARQCQHNKVQVVWNPAPDLPLLEVVSDQIEQVFLNLLINALDAMPEGGQLRVSTAYIPQPPKVRVEFTDTGTGIDPQVLPHIFDTFFTTKDTGTGLGLGISKNIAEQHGGRIEVETRLGEGTTFTVWLPAELKSVEEE